MKYKNLVADDLHFIHSVLHILIFVWSHFPRIPRAKTFSTEDNKEMNRFRASDIVNMRNSWLPLVVIEMACSVKCLEGQSLLRLSMATGVLCIHQKMNLYQRQRMFDGHANAQQESITNIRHQRGGTVGTFCRYSTNI